MGITILGLVAASLTTFAFLPQIVKVWRSKSAQDISMSWLITFSSGIFLWLVYGLILGQLPIIMANATTLGLTLVILYFKFKYQSK
jgi:MtN3 and saliva related transmembrane protein